jgi:DNA-directed RNA polymerase subunit alpha
MSNAIHTPTLSSVKEHDDKTATFVIEPLQRGYGMTLGNSLRRVLLSSIAGAAVTGFRIEGVSHEFTAIAGIKEDVVAIMLNLKQIRFKIFSEEPQVLHLSKKGKGIVKAEDIKLNANVELVNPDQIICTIDDPKASITADIMVEGGRGYRALEEHGSGRKISDMIALDALFTPVLRVRYKVENTRVGQVTDLDRLLLTITTDGSITPKEAFEEANAILVAQYSALAGQTRVETTGTLTEKGEIADETEEGEEPAELLTSIEDLNLSARTTNALINNDIHTIKDLLSLNEAELRDLKGFGNKALEEVKEKIAELEL